MKKFEVQLISVAIGILALAAHRSYTLENDVGSNMEDPSLIHMRALTVEEEALANDARAHIAQTIENNLVRLFAVISAGNERQPRQEDADGGEDTDVDLAAVTPNPNVLPQVAQILGAIFSGSLNITCVVDQTFGLVPNLVREQVGGLVKLLTGESMSTEMKGEASTETAAVTEASTAPPPAPIVVTPSPANPEAPAAEIVEVESTTGAKEPAVNQPTRKPATTMSTRTMPTTTPAPKPTPTPTKESIVVESVDDEEILTIAAFTSKPASSSDPENANEKIKYRVRQKTKPTSTAKPLKPMVLEDDEIEKLEEEIRRAARAYEPYVRDKQPRFFTTAFRNIFGRVDFNMTEIARAVPSIFKGARQAFTVLENLGILDVNGVLDELNLAELEEEEE